MEKSSLIKNSSFSVLQMVVTAITALVLFKLLVYHTGIKATGLWSFLTSVNAITGFGSFGFANALLYYIPRYKMEANNQHTSALINTAFLAVCGFTLILSIAAYAAFSLIIPFSLESDFHKQAYQLLPFVILSFFFAGLSATFLSVLDGLMLIHVRAKINMVSSMLLLTAGPLLLLRMGITGIMIAQLLQNVFLLIVAYWYVKKNIPAYRFSISFNKALFRNIARYGFNFQVISVTQIISDPFMKSVISRYAGMNITAMFDFSIKLLSVFRSLLIAANQSIVPQLTVFHLQRRKKRIQVFYKANFRMVLYAGILFFVAPVALANSISVLFLGEVSQAFRLTFSWVALGLLVNAIALPAYFYYVGTGNLRWNVMNNMLTALIVLLISPLVGMAIGGVAVVACWSMATIIGSFVLFSAIRKEEDIVGGGFYSSADTRLMIVIVIACFINGWLLPLLFPHLQPAIMILAEVTVLVLFIAYPLLKHPLTSLAYTRIAGYFQ